MTESSFAIVERISEGPNAVVYKARQVALNRFVLLKRLRHHLLTEPEARARFMREAQAIAMLKSDHIVQIYDVTEFEQAPAIVMEYIEGRSLAEIIGRDERPEESFVRDVARGVLKALSYAHARGIVHRDIKPGNILVDADGRIKLTDFGIAAIAAEPSLTSEGSLLGTPAYMSPEQARGEGVDHRTDFFSLGASLLELVTGEKAFDGTTYAECLTKILSFKDADLGHRLDGVAPSLRPLLIGLMAPDKQSRFADADEALRHLETGTPRRVRGRNWRRVAVAGGGVAVIAAAATLMMNPAQRPPRPAPVIPDTVKTEDRNSSVKIVPEPPIASEHSRAEREPERRQSDTGPAPISTPTTAHLTAPSTDSGYLSITCRPWARVFIDSQFIETTPVAGTIKVPAGRHSVTFTNPDFAPIVRTILVTKNTMSSVSADFVSLSGYLYVTVDPWAEVYVDDQYRDTTPLSRPLLISAGRRRLRLHNPGSRDISTTITVTQNDTLRLDFRMQLAERKK